MITIIMIMMMTKKDLGLNAETGADRSLHAAAEGKSCC